MCRCLRRRRACRLPAPIEEVIAAITFHVIPVRGTDEVIIAGQGSGGGGSLSMEFNQVRVGELHGAIQGADGQPRVARGAEAQVGDCACFS